MSRLYDSGQALARHLVVAHGYMPLAQALPGLESVSQSLDVALGLFDGADLRVVAVILDEDAADADMQVEGLREALRVMEDRVPGRIKATAWLLTETLERAQALRTSFLAFDDGHFLAKTLVGRGVLCIDTAQGWSLGRLAAQPSVAELAAHIDAVNAPGEEEARRQLQARLADERQTRQLLKPGVTPATWGLIALNVAAFVLQNRLAASAAVDPGSPQAWHDALLRLGGNDPALTLGQHQYWRLAAACFLHGDIFHILANMASLYSLGAIVERLCGPWRFLGLYALTGLAASLLSAVCGRAGVPSIGASGAIFGLAGALLAPHWRRDARFPKDLADRLFSWLLRPLGFILLLGLGLQVMDLPFQFDNFAHLGGLLCGLAVAYIYPPFLIRKTDRKG